MKLVICCQKLIIHEGTYWGGIYFARARGESVLPVLGQELWNGVIRGSAVLSPGTLCCFSHGAVFFSSREHPLLLCLLLCQI